MAVEITVGGDSFPLVPGQDGRTGDLTARLFRNGKRVSLVTPTDGSFQEVDLVDDNHEVDVLCGDKKVRVQIKRL